VLIRLKFILRQRPQWGTWGRLFAPLGWVGLTLVLGLAASAVPGENQGANPVSSADRHVVMISIDGLGASWYMSPPPELRTPNLRRLREEGSYAEGVEGVYPSVTYPSHTTLVTGRLPGEHGIFTNLSSRLAGKNPKDWFWFASAIRVPTLWDVLRDEGLTTAAAFWPVTAGARITWDIPEIWDPQKGMVGDPLYVAKFSTPGLLFEAALDLGPPSPGEEGDTTRTKLAAFLIRKHKPNLLLLHLAALDETEHRHGPGSAEAAATLEKSDTHLGEILGAIRAAGLADTTDVFVVSDHGFLPVERLVNPNVLLAKAGLLEVDAAGNITGGKISTVANGGSFFIYWPESADLRRKVEAALAPLREEGILWGELSRQATRDLGAEPAIQLALEAAPGVSFDDSAKGDVVRKLSSTTGAHGYLPFRAGLESAFIAWGPHIQKGVNLQRVRMTAIAPTVLWAFGAKQQKLGSDNPLKAIFK
jgi:predicted AlkP superfamily pyrophosphatase or phosphodiesterase